MKESEVDEVKLANGEYCQKGVTGCFCKGGRPYERQCSKCRDTRQLGDDRDYCVCPPPEWLMKKYP